MLRKVLLYGPMRMFLHLPLSVELIRDLPDEENDPPPNTYSLLPIFKPDRPAQRFHGVYIPPNIAFVLKSGETDMYQLVQLETADSIAHRGLDRNARYVVLGVKTQAGRCLYEYPEAWKKLRRSKELIGWSMLSVSLSFLSLNLHPAVNIAAACLFAMGFSAWRYSRHLSLPAFAGEVWSRPSGFESVEWKPPPVWIPPF
jgi:hypothetical protein